jgi:hypothetical protein
MTIIAFFVGCAVGALAAFFVIGCHSVNRVEKE